MEVDYLGEGVSDEAIARRLILFAGHQPGRSYSRGKPGKNQIDRRLPGLNAGAAFGSPPLLVLRDKDEDARCAGDLVVRLLPNRVPRLLLRICVCAADAWLMADRLGYAKCCGVPVRAVPAEPEALVRPKDVVLGWLDRGAAGRLGRFVTDERRRRVPDWRSIGTWHADFAHAAWSPERAVGSGAAPSLERALRRLRELDDRAGS